MSEIRHVVQLSEKREEVEPKHTSPWKYHYGQIFRFSMTGGLNTMLDLLILNGLFWWFPTSNMVLVLLFNSLAYSMGAVNSFLMNKYWTFQQRQEVTFREVRRFVVTTLGGICCNNTIIWYANMAFHVQNSGSIFWINASKGIAIAGTMLISFCGMRLWVFVNNPQLVSKASSETRLGGCVISQKTKVSSQRIPSMQTNEGERLGDRYSLSVILPAYNEEQVIAHTVSDILDVLDKYLQDFEVIVVNDGSTDQTAALVSSFSSQDQRVRLVSHSTNQGYGAALISGFAAATKELTFFMDSDGQFDIRDLHKFFALIDRYDAVVGYRIDRQDHWMRRFNAWGWKRVVGLVLGVHVRDLDCAFKLLHTQFLHTHPLETHGAMINAELLYKLKQAGCTYKEVGVRHLPRRSGRATGANPAVIARAFGELFISTRKWKREQSTQTIKEEQHEVSLKRTR